MSSKQWIAGGLLRLATWPADKSRLLSTSSKSQKWINPTTELRYYTDPEYRLRKLEASSIYMAQRYQDPGLRDKLLASAKARMHKHRQSESVRVWERLLKWCSHYDWVRDRLPWTTYRPKFYPEKTEHSCTGCKITQRHGRKLWWCRISDSSDQAERKTSLGDSSADEQYLCSPCYRETENTMPQGFEGVTSMKYLRARAKALGINIDKKPGQEKQLFDQAPQKRGSTHESKA